MKIWFLCLLLIFTAACGRSDEPKISASDNPQTIADQAVVEAQEIADRALRGEKPEVATEGLEGCEIFDTGLVIDIFEVDPSVVTYDRSIPVKSAGHLVCSAHWDKPNKEELDKAYSDAIQEWARNMTKPDRKPQPKYPQVDNRVSLTLTANSFDSPDEAVASLENTIETLSKGVTFKVAGKDHETKMAFGEWLDGVGDKAIFTDKGALMVAYDAQIFTVNVSVMGDKSQDREKALELAQRVIDGL